MQRSVVLNTAIFEVEKSSARDLQNIHFIDLTDALCRADVCWSIQGDEIMYRDNNHLTGSFADHLMPIIEKNLLAILDNLR